MNSQYVLEAPFLPLGAVDFLAADDSEAVKIANDYLDRQQNKLIGLKLWRYPLMYVDKPRGWLGNTNGLIEIPFYRKIN